VHHTVESNDHTCAEAPAVVRGSYAYHVQQKGWKDIGYNTQCPGDVLYKELSTTRTWAGGPVAGLTLKSITGAGTSGSTVYTKADATVNWSVTTVTSLDERVLRPAMVAVARPE
jgi:hypothetical protein